MALSAPDDRTGVPPSGDGRLARAEEQALAALDDMADAGIRGFVTGSLASGRFSTFSDVDFLIEGSWDDWSRAVTIIEARMGGYPVDVMASRAVPADMLIRLREGALDASALRARRRQVATTGGRHANAA